MKTRIARFSIFYSLLYLLLMPVHALAQDRVVESDTHRFVEVADGVWFATGAIYGYLRKPLAPLARILLMLVALVAILPVDLGGAGYISNVLALLVGGGIVFLPSKTPAPQPDP